MRTAYDSIVGYLSRSRHISREGCFGTWNEFRKTSFAGLFPAKEPRYSICVFIHRPIEPTHSPKDLATSVVNELITWLMKY
nr:hypothetical protein [Prevotella sp.]